MTKVIPVDSIGVRGMVSAACSKKKSTKLDPSKMTTFQIRDRMEKLSGVMKARPGDKKAVE